MQADEEVLALFLIDAGLLSRPQLADVRARAASSGETLPRALSLSGALSEDEVRRTMSKVLGIPFVELYSHAISPDALAIIPEPFSRTHGVVAYGLQGDHSARGAQVLEVALLDTAQYELVKQLHLPYTVQVRMTDRASMTRALLLYQQILKNTFLPRASAESSAVDALLERALYSAAESIHIVGTSAGFVVRYRIAGMLHDAITLSDGVGQEVLSRVQSLAHLSPQAQVPQEGSFKIITEGEQVLVRVMALPTVLGETMTLHLARSGSGRVGYTLESLGFHGMGLASVRRALARRSGLALVSGDEHSGKTTLLYTLLDLVGGYTHTALTVEETVSAHLPFALQTEAGDTGPVSMGAGLRAALRQDPDVLMVSDIADRESALLAVEAANRGIFVIAGIAAPSAARGVEKLLSFGVSPRMLAASLSVAVGTSLVRALCPACRGELYRLTRAEMSALEGEIDFSRVLLALKEEGVLTADAPWKEVSFLRPGGCTACQGGYQGRVALQEVMPNSLTIKEAILASEGGGAIEAIAREEGMLSLLEDGIYKAARGQTSAEEGLSLEA